MRIAHTADIHIRSLSRHDEYQQILKSFTEDCRKQKVDHIFIGGDIFHTKTSGISPEYIDFLTWWLNDMASVAPVHMILGNHDGNLVNLTRQDSVTPIVEAIKNPRIFLYKKSGVYTFAPGYNWCVFSCFDEEGWKDVKPTAGSVNIATFHGSIRNSVTESGWELEEGDINIEFFNEYDFVLLGDIHKQQFLGYRNNKPWIAYPGTPIQQNYAEDINHGYLLWDIENNSEWNVVSRSLPNPKPFMTIDWAGSLEKTLDLCRKCPSGSRFRIRSSIKLTQDDVHILSETLKTSLNATEVTYKSDFQLDTKVVKSKTSSIAKTDLRSPEVITQLVREYHKESNLTEKELESIDEQSRYYLSQVASLEETVRGAKWSLRHLTWNNLFSYGEDNVINFEKLNGIVGIFGPNRTGKSSIVGTLMYSLFNTTDRGPMKNINVCNVRKDYCSSRVIFDYNGTPHVIERQTTKSTNKKGLVSATTALNLFKMRDDGEMDDLCGEQRSDTEKSVKKLLGNAEDFLMTSLSAQGEINHFITQGSSKRRSILTRFLDLDVFDKMHELASKEVTSVKSQLKNFPERNWSEIKAQSELDIISLKEKITSLDDQIYESQSKLMSLRQELSSLKATPITKEDVDIQRKRVSDLQKKADECSNLINTLEEEIETLEEKQSTVQSIIDSIDIDSLRKKQNDYRKLQSDISDMKHVYERENTLLLQQTRSLKILDEVPCGDNYPTCKFIKDAHSNKTAVLDQKNKVEKTFLVLQESQKSLLESQGEFLVEKISKYEKAYDLSSKIKLEISKKETEIAKLKSSCNSCSASLEEAKTKLQDLESLLNNEKNDEVISIRSQISKLSSFIKDCDAQKLETASSLGKIQSLMEKLDEEKKNRDSLLQKVRIHELISQAFSKKGIPLLVTKSQLPIINQEVTNILQGIVDFTIELESDEDTDTLEIYIDYGDSKRIIELCSGMEKTLAALALRVAMINVSSLPKSDFFIIDEGFGTLDSAGVESVNRLLLGLKKYFKTLVIITHVDGIKDSADFILEITKNEKDSKLEFN